MRLRVVGCLLIAVGLATVPFYFAKEGSPAALGMVGVLLFGIGASLLAKANRKPA